MYSFLIKSYQFGFTPFLVFALLLTQLANADIARYEITIDYKTVNYTGEPVQALALDDQIPAPLIEATVGDTLEVTFHNRLDSQASIHWHGILLPHDQDGVSYLTTQPIEAGKSFTFSFPVTHHGTYWYHSHTGLQEQRGIYGPLVFRRAGLDQNEPNNEAHNTHAHHRHKHHGQGHHKKIETTDYDHELILVWSDWTNENPNQVLANLKKEGHFYAYKKQSVQSWLGVLHNGPEAIKQRLAGAWSRMGPMDVSDVGYDQFLANGQASFVFDSPEPGDKVLVRMINAAASSYFNVEYAGGSMQVVAADGVDVVPAEVDQLHMAIAETYDVIVEIPEDGQFQLRAANVDGTGYAEAMLGGGAKNTLPDIERENPYLTGHHDHSGHTDADESEHDEHAHHKMHGKSGHSGHAMHQTESSKAEGYEFLQAREPTAFPEGHTQRTVELVLTGDMERYVWSFDNKTLSEADSILIRKGEQVRFVFRNQTMMHHPLHLHGHFFRVLNGQGDYSPLKHTVNVPPMGHVEIEFLATEEKDWFFHCHNLYHMKSGMARVISYEETTRYDDELRSKIAMDDHWFYRAELSMLSHMSELHGRWSNHRHAFKAEADHDYESSYDAELLYAYQIDRFLYLYTGGEFEQDEDESENAAVIGVGYVLPMLIDSKAQVDSEGHGKLELSSHLQLTDQLKFGWKWNTEEEYRFELKYRINNNLSFALGHDDEYETGLGLTVAF